MKLLVIRMAAVTVADSPPKRRKGELEKGESPVDELKMASKETKMSPPSKGVGLFGLDSSLTMNGDIDVPVKDPKVWSLLYNYMNSLNSFVSIHTETSNILPFPPTPTHVCSCNTSVQVQRSSTCYRGR